MTVLIREGSVSKDLHALAPILDLDTSAFLALCTDDRNPLDIAEEGHLDYMIRTADRPRRAAARGLSRRLAHRRASAFGLRDRGLVAPGRRADIVLLDDLETCAVCRRHRRRTPRRRRALRRRGSVAPVGLDSVKARARRRRGFRRRRRCRARPR